MTFRLSLHTPCDLHELKRCAQRRTLLCSKCKVLMGFPEALGTLRKLEVRISLGLVMKLGLNMGL